MAKVVFNMSMSLDGFIAGPNVGEAFPMGEGGQRLHEWLFNTAMSDADAEIGREMSETTGAVVLGRRTFDVGLTHWGDTPFPAPSFVLTHEARKPLVQKSGTFTFVCNGIDSALQHAKAAAGEKNVRLMGADVVQQFLIAGLVAEMQIQLVPVILGSGTRLFEHLGVDRVELECTKVIKSPRVTHLRYIILK